MDRVPVYPATGEVYLNAEPAAGVQLRVHPKAQVDAGKDPESYEQHTGVVGEDGTVSFTTYEFGDGLPAGEYVVTFVKQPLRKTVVGMGARPIRTSKDDLGGKYSDPQNSDVTLTVTPEGENSFARVNLEVDVAAVQAEQEAGQGRPGDIKAGGVGREED